MRESFLQRLKNYIYFIIPTLIIPSVSRISLDIKLKQLFKNLKPGVVLEVGSGFSSYKKYIPYIKYMTLDIDERSKPDIVGDIHNIEWESNYFDTVIAIEILEHLCIPEQAINEIYRILKPRGICILSTRFFHSYHPGPKDYYRFTWDSLYYLFRKFKKVEIYHHGNKAQVIWHIISDGKGKVFFNIFNPLIARIRFQKTKFPLGFVVYAEK